MAFCKPTELPFDANILWFDYSHFNQLGRRGHSFESANPNAPAAAWLEETNWRVSAAHGGSPAGQMMPPPSPADPELVFADWADYYGVIGTNALSDSDGDSLANFLEFALDLDLVRFSEAPAIVRNAGGRLEMHLRLPENPLVHGAYGANQTVYRVQASSDLAVWSDIAQLGPPPRPWSGPATRTVGPPANGSVPVTIEDVTAAAPRWLRLQVELSEAEPD
jgi:hypothetical protein